MADMNCEDCKGSGVIETEGVKWSRPYYSKENNQITRDFYGDGNWQLTQCHCVGDE